MFYRFANGIYVEADSFEQAQAELIERITEEKEDKNRWHKCSCTGLSHRLNCPEHPVNQGEIPF